MSQQQGQLTEANRVFEIQELLEEVLNHLDLPDLVRALCLTQRFRATLLTATKFKHRLEQAIWLRPVPRHSWYYETAEPYLIERITHDPDDSQDEFEGKCFVGKLHPLLPCSNAAYWQHIRTTKCELDLPALRQIPPRRTDDLITQPPCTRAGVFRRLEERMVLDGSITRIEGVRVRDVLEAVNTEARPLQEDECILLWIPKFIMEDDARIVRAKEYGI